MKKLKNISYTLLITLVVFACSKKDDNNNNNNNPYYNYQSYCSNQPGTYSTPQCGCVPQDGCPAGQARCQGTCVNQGYPNTTWNTCTPGTQGYPNCQTNNCTSSTPGYPYCQNNNNLAAADQWCRAYYGASAMATYYQYCSSRFACVGNMGLVGCAFNNY